MITVIFDETLTEINLSENIYTYKNKTIFRDPISIKTAIFFFYISWTGTDILNTKIYLVYKHLSLKIFI